MSHMRAAGAAPAYILGFLVNMYCEGSRIRGTSKIVKGSAARLSDKNRSKHQKFPG